MRPGVAREGCLSFATAATAKGHGLYTMGLIEHLGMPLAKILEPEE